MVPNVVLPSLMVTVEPASAVPVMVGVLSLSSFTPSTVKAEEEAKRKKLQDQIAAQKEQIKQKEQLIAEKRKKLETV